MDSSTNQPHLEEDLLTQLFIVVEQIPQIESQPFLQRNLHSPISTLHI